MTTQKIKILDPFQAIKIAAGEVIERPAHIIKELIENSIDAGASNITLHLQHAGKDFIKITDDGCGMSNIDAKLCFAHHATSKIETVEDLATVMTYGFRGEALSSIACVSRVELVSKTQDEKLATRIQLHYSKLIEETQVNHPTGTSFTISHLFDNVPARKKFLKSDETEWNLIVTIIQAFCLRYPQINFKIFHNDFMAFNCAATTKIKSRAAQLWNNNLHDTLIDLAPSTTQNITISGALSNPHYYRFNRGQIFTFVNNRWVKNQELFKGIMKGYDGVLPLQKFPAAFLFIEIDPNEVDINIHPKKEEVKFLHPGTVQKLIEIAVKNCLGSQIKQTFEQPAATTQAPKEFSINNFSPISPTFFKLQSHIAPQQILKTTQNNDFNNSLDPRSKSEMTGEESWPTAKAFTSEEKYEPFLKNPFPNEPFIKSTPTAPEINIRIYDEPSYSIIGQFKKTYIIIEKSEQFIMVDQHGAHERILYERFKSHMTQAPTIQLLFPHIVKMTTEEITSLELHQALFSKHGIVFEQFNDHEIIIQATPVEMSAKSAQEILQTVLKWLQQHQDLTASEIIAQLTEKVLAEKACKAACKAGDTLNHEQMQNILNELAKTENNFCCPHGRPTMWTLPLKDIEKHFKRDYVGAKVIF